VFDLSAKRELNRGFGDALATAFELALTPVIMGLIGWGIDAWLGTKPAFALFLFVFTVGYEIWKLFGRYDQRMAAHAAEVKGLRPRAGQAGPGAPDAPSAPNAPDGEEAGR
jgi:hypothetical protein